MKRVPYGGRHNVLAVANGEAQRHAADQGRWGETYLRGLIVR